MPNAPKDGVASSYGADDFKVSSFALAVLDSRLVVRFLVVERAIKILVVT